MNEKRFVDDGYEAIDEQSFTDTLTDKTYYVDYFDEIIELVNNLSEENEQLKKSLRIYSDSLRAEIRETKEVMEDWSECIDEKKQLKEENEQLKQFISKIDFAIIRKYDNSLENLLDEVYDGEYENWIKKQVSRAKKLDGDMDE